MIKRVSTILILVSACALAVAPAAQAQMAAWEDRGFVNISGAFQSRSATSVTSSSSFSIYDETATIETSQSIEGAKAFFDIGAGARVVGNLGIGFAYTTLTTTGTGSVTARVPHPLLYDSPRTASASVEGLDHKEKAFHIMALFMLPVSDTFDVAVFAGPTYFKLSQGTIGDVQVSEVGPPYTSVNLTAPAVVTTDVSKWGLNVGADVTYKFTRNLGVGGFIRWAGAKVDVTPANSSAISVNVGGVQYGAGLRLRF